jgi:hypothetical protein
MPRSKHALARSPQRRRIELQLHQLVHVAQHQHVAVELHDALIFGQAERRQLRPAVVEARVVGVVDRDFGEQVGDVLCGDATGGEGRETGGGEGVGVERDEGVGGIVLLEGVVEG